MHRSMFWGVIIDCDNLDAGVAFWSQALGYEAGNRDGEFVFLKVGPEETGIGLQAVPEPKTAKSRMHIDILTDDVEAEVRRLEKLGATRQQQFDCWWVMLDPCGNEFCVILHADPQNMGSRVRTWEA